MVISNLAGATRDIVITWNHASSIECDRSHSSSHRCQCCFAASKGHAGQHRIRVSLLDRLGDLDGSLIACRFAPKGIIDISSSIAKGRGSLIRQDCSSSYWISIEHCVRRSIGRAPRLFYVISGRRRSDVVGGGGCLGSTVRVNARVRVGRADVWCHRIWVRRILPAVGWRWFSRDSRSIGRRLT